MPEKNIDEYGAPQVQDKRNSPPGVLPKNAHAWVISALAAVMVGAIALSGGKTTKDQPKSAQQASIVLDPNAIRIQDYKKHIEEKTQKLQAEQDGLIEKQRAFAASSAQTSGTNPPVSTLFSPPSEGAQAIRAEKEKREYESLFASNIVSTSRAEPASKPANPTSLEDLAKVISLYPALALLQGGRSITGSTEAAAGPAQPTQPSNPDATGHAAAGPKPNEGPSGPGQIRNSDPSLYRLFEGTFIETVLTNRLDGSFSGPVNCMVTSNVYSRNGQHVLIPQGSRVLGEVRKVETFGQERLAVSFHRLIMPNGYSVNLDKFQGLNQIGENGLRDRINHHFFQVFGVSLAIGAIAGLAETNSRTGFDRSAADAYEQGVATSLSQSSLRILDRYLNVLPTFTIREGHRVKIYLSQDLVLPAYDEHPFSNE